MRNFYVETAIDNKTCYVIFNDEKTMNQFIYRDDFYSKETGIRRQVTKRIRHKDIVTYGNEEIFHRYATIHKELAKNYADKLITKVLSVRDSLEGSNDTESEAFQCYRVFRDCISKLEG